MPSERIRVPDLRQIGHSLPEDPYSFDPWSWAFVLFRHVPDFPGYGVDTLGGVWSCLKPGPCRGYYERWKRLRAHVDEKGYLGFNAIRLDGCKRHFFVHSLVLTVFGRPRPRGLICLHCNGIPSDNRLGNLRWGTHSENETDKVRHGTNPEGRRNGAAKLTEEDIPLIKALSARGMFRREVAAVFGVTPMAIQRIVDGTGWKHVH